MDQAVEMLWSRPLRMRPSATTVAASDGLVVAERHTRLVRLEPRTGTLMWEQRVEDCWGTTVIAQERCLYLSQQGVLHCFELQSGSRIWSKPGLRLRRYLTVSGSVIVLGGWRGYHPVTRIDLATGASVPSNSPYAAGESLAWPTAVRFAAGPDSVVDAVLLASGGRPELRLEDAGTGAALGAWPLAEPVRFPDSGIVFTKGEDGRVVFVSGRRTIMSFHPSTGVQALWEHDRDLPPQAPVLVDDQLMLAEELCITMVDLAGGGYTEIGPSASGTVLTPVPVAEGALFARVHGEVVLIGRHGVQAAVRLPTRVEQLFPGADTLAYAIGKGHFTALNVSIRER